MSADDEISTGYEDLIPSKLEQSVADRADRRRASLEERRMDPRHLATVDAIGRAIEPEKQFISGAAEQVLGLPWDIAGTMTRVAPLMLNRDAQADAFTGNTNNPVSDFLFDQGQSARRGIKNMLGAEEDPQHFLNRTAHALGAAAIQKKNLIPTAAIVGGVNAGAEAISRAFDQDYAHIIKPPTSVRSFFQNLPYWTDKFFLGRPQKHADANIREQAMQQYIDNKEQSND